jgi:hypothetical protein
MPTPVLHRPAAQGDLPPVACPLSPDGRLAPYQELALAVVERLWLDLVGGSASRRQDAGRAVADGTLLVWLGRMGVNERTAQWADAQARIVLAGRRDLGARR